MSGKRSCLILLTAIVGAVGLLTGCGGGSAAPPPPAITVSVSPSSAMVNQGATQTFTASVAGTTNTAVTWSVLEGPAGGTITSAGIYTAPSTAGTFHIMATSQTDSAKSATAAVTVPSVSVAISPPAATVDQGATTSFTANVSGTVINTSVTWSVQEGATGGTVSSAGAYTAPLTAGVFHLVATSQADPTKSGVSTITVPAVSVSVSPMSDTLGPNGLRTFVATVSGTVVSTSVTWSVEEGAAGGSITSNGTYTAPTTTGTFHVVAMSAADPSASGAAIVTVVPSGFTPTADMGTSRTEHTATLLPNGTVLLAGGNSSSPFNQTGEIFDPATNSFSPTGSLVSPRRDHTATLLPNGKVLIAGGISSSSSAAANVVATAELYDPATRTFTATGSMAVPRREHAATLLADGKVLVAGGVDNNGIFLSSAEIYDTATGTFTSTGNLITGRANHAAVLLASGKVLVAGGCCDISSSTGVEEFNSAELYEPVAGTFAATGSLVDVREGFTMTPLPDGRVLAAGGLFSETPDACAANADVNALCVGPLNSVELYDPSTSTFTLTGKMLVARGGHTATRLPSGTVLVAGGRDGFNSNYTAELYNPATGTFSFTGSMENDRFDHTATMLNDGRVLVTGGRKCSVSPLTGNSTCVNLSSAEIYK